MIINQFTSEMYKNIGEDGQIWFDCPYCGMPIYADTQDEPRACVCGKIFHASIILYEYIDEEIQ